MALGSVGVDVISWIVNYKLKKKIQPLPLIEAINNNPPPQSQHNLIKKPQLLIHPSLEITIRPPIIKKLDDDDEDIFKIDEVHNDLNTLFSFSMSLNDKSPTTSVELGTSASLALTIVPLDSHPPSQYTKHDWEKMIS